MLHIWGRYLSFNASHLGEIYFIQCFTFGGRYRIQCFTFGVSYRSQCFTFSVRSFIQCFTFGWDIFHPMLHIWVRYISSNASPLGRYISSNASHLGEILNLVLHIWGEIYFIRYFTFRGDIFHSMLHISGEMLSNASHFNRPCEQLTSRLKIRILETLFESQSMAY